MKTRDKEFEKANKTKKENSGDQQEERERKKVKQRVAS